MVFVKCLKEASVLSSLTESEDEQHLLLHHGWRHTKCSCIPSPVHATASRSRRNEKQKHPFLERISHVASTPPSSATQSANAFARRDWLRFGSGHEALPKRNQSRRANALADCVADGRS